MIHYILYNYSTIIHIILFQNFIYIYFY